MRIYLDICSFNRPFDDQSQPRVRLEAEAVLLILQGIREARLRLVWSFMMDLENDDNPLDDRRNEVQSWRSTAVEHIAPTHEAEKLAGELTTSGLKTKDAVHVACAILGAAEYLVTTDDLLRKRAKNEGRIKVVSPLEFVTEVP